MFITALLVIPKTENNPDVLPWTIGYTNCGTSKPQNNTPP